VTECIRLLLDCIDVDGFPSTVVSCPLFHEPGQIAQRQEPVDTGLDDGLGAVEQGHKIVHLDFRVAFDSFPDPFLKRRELIKFDDVYH